MRRRYVPIVVGLVILIATSDSRAEEPPDDPPTAHAASIATDFLQNSLRADKEWSGKWVRVRGSIVSIDKDILGYPYVILDAEGPLAVQCSFDPSRRSYVETLRTGQEVWLLGRCEGKLLNVQIADCRADVPNAAPTTRRHRGAVRRPVQPGATQ